MRILNSSCLIYYLLLSVLQDFAGRYCVNACGCALYPEERSWKRNMTSLKYAAKPLAAVENEESLMQSLLSKDPSYITGVMAFPTGNCPVKLHFKFSFITRCSRDPQERKYLVSNNWIESGKISTVFLGRCTILKKSYYGKQIQETH